MNRMLDLFSTDPAEPHRETLAPGAWVLRGLALSVADTLRRDIEHITRLAPFRHLKTPGGLPMSVAMTNCGRLGWTSDRRGYRYVDRDPLSGAAWPPMPQAFNQLARSAAAAAEFPDFTPDACLVNRYVPGTRLTLHQDKDEEDYAAPIVSVSLGLPATFLFGGDARSDRQRRIPLRHGDVVVWGGPSRLRYHGILPLEAGEHETWGGQRLNLTFRCAGAPAP